MKDHAVCRLRFSKGETIVSLTVSEKSIAFVTTSGSYSIHISGYPVRVNFGPKPGGPEMGNHT